MRDSLFLPVATLLLSTSVAAKPIVLDEQAADQGTWYDSMEKAQANAADDDYLCRPELVTGTHIKKLLCRTVAEWRMDADRNRQAAEQMTRHRPQMQQDNDLGL